MDLIQKRLFVLREYSLGEHSLKIFSKDLTSSEERNIPYEEIDTSKVLKQRQTDNIMMIVTLIFGTFFLINIFNPANYVGDDLLPVALFLFFVTLGSGLITYIKSKSLILIPTANSGFIELHQKIPNQQEVDNFLKELDLKIKSHLISKYGTIDKDLPVEPQLMNLSWLKERNILTVEEFNALKSKLVNKKNDEDSIGFH